MCSYCSFFLLFWNHWHNSQAEVSINQSTHSSTCMYTLLWYYIIVKLWSIPIINPRPRWRRVTVLSWFVCVSVCLSVCYHKIAVYLKIWTCYSSESFQRVSNPALLQGWQAQATQTAQKIWKCKNFMYRDKMKRLCNKTKASTDVTHDIQKIICEDLWRNVHVWRYDVVYWPCPSPCCRWDR